MALTHYCRKTLKQLKKKKNIIIYYLYLTCILRNTKIALHLDGRHNGKISEFSKGNFNHELHVLS